MSLVEDVEEDIASCNSSVLLRDLATLWLNADFYNRDNFDDGVDEETIERYLAPFENTPAIDFVHHTVHRYGFTSNVTEVIEYKNQVILNLSTTDQDGGPVITDKEQDYLIGLLATSITTGIIFICWTFLLIEFRFCLGPSKVGGLSGKMSKLPPKPIPLPTSVVSSKQKSTSSSSSHNISSEKDDDGDSDDDNSNGQIDSVDDSQEKQEEDQQSTDLPAQLSLDEWSNTYNKAKRRHRICKAIVIFAAMCIIVLAFTLCFMGVGSLVHDSIGAGLETIDIAQDLAAHGIELIDEVIETTSYIGQNITGIVTAAHDTICPEFQDFACDQINVIENNFDSLQGCDFSIEFEDVFVDDATFKDFVNQFNDTRNDFLRDLASTRNNLEDIVEFTESIENKVEYYNWAFQVERIIAFVVAGLCCVIIISLLVPKTCLLVTLRHCVFAPIFLILVILCWIFSMVFIVGSTSVADMCVDSPDSRFLLLLERFENKLSPMVYQFAIFYINRCPKPDVPTTVANQMSTLVSAVTKYHNFLISFLELWRNNSNRIQSFCGFNEPPPAIQIATLTEERVCVLIAFLVELAEFFQCQQWYPLYSTAVYDAVCYSGTEGFAWVAGSTLGIVVMSMIIFTCRCAFYDLEIDEQEPEDDSNDKEAAVAEVDEVDGSSDDTSDVDKST